MAENLKWVIGVDFDNTIASYDEILYELALKFGWISPSFSKNKKQIRDHIRSLPEGEKKWQMLQASIYGPEMKKAKLLPGVMEFLQKCHEQGIPVFIISHKTQFANFDSTKTDLKKVALEWMTSVGIFERRKTGLSPDHVYFEKTREEKVARINERKCTHFIDDLEETFLEPTFPKNVSKILYSSDGSDWHDISICLDRTTWNSISKLLNLKIESVALIRSGRNSRLFKVCLENGTSVGAKFYFQSKYDARDRMKVEFKSLSFIRDCGITCVAKPLQYDQEMHLAVYEWVEGERIKGDEASVKEIDLVIAFLTQLRALCKRKEANDFAPASEACFSLQQLFKNLNARFDRLKAVNQPGKPFEQMHQFLSNQLEAAYDVLVMQSTLAYRSQGLPIESEISFEQKTLSPSDFGFHNAIRKSDGTIVFLDFEYFGWDDPAKTICDFLLHPAMNLSEPNKKYFVSRILEVFKDDKTLVLRARTLLPLFALKWCLILLNEFVASDFERREFALLRAKDRNLLLIEQLDKAQKMFENTRLNHDYFR